MANDISTIAARLLKSLYSIPSYESVKQAIESGSLIHTPEATIKNLFPAIDGAIDGNNLDRFYEIELERVLNDSKGENVVYRYLGFTADFRIIKQLYLKYRAASISGYAKTLETEDASKLRLLPEYITLLKNSEKIFHEVDDTFEFVNRIDGLYLQALAEVAVESNNEYVKRVVKQKIDNYHLMTVLRMTQLGKSPEVIQNLFITVHELGVMPQTLDKMQAHDVVTQIGTQVGLAPADISVTAIETRLNNKEIGVINQATFEGVSGERIIQYFERLKYCIADIKVALAAHAMDLPAEEVLKRCVNYEAK